MLTEQLVRELQSALSQIDRAEEDAECERLARKGIFPLRILDVGRIKVHIYREEGSHKLPHFHIEYKREYRASYGIKSLRRIIGEMPRKYEQPILKWARSNQAFLMASWNSIMSGGGPVSFEDAGGEPSLDF